MFESFRNHSSVFLLSSLLALGLLHGFFAGRAGENAVLPVVFLAALVAATAEAAPSRKLTLIAGGLAGLTFSTVVAVRWLHIEALLLALWIVLSTFLVFSVFLLLQKVLRPGSVSRAKLYDAVSIYLLLGLAWFALYNWTEQQAPGSFRDTADGLSHPITPEALLYLSFSTLTTVGFGDVVAVRSVSRMLLGAEAIAGVLYVAILVARLTALYDHRGALRRSSIPPNEDSTN